MGLFGPKPEPKPMGDREAMGIGMKYKQQEIAQAEDPASEALHHEMQDQRSNFLRWTQDLDERRDYLKFTLKNYELIQTPQGNEWKPVMVDGKPLPPLANDNCIRRLLALADGFLSKNLINSNFDENRVLLMLRNSMWNLVTVLVIDFTKYGINGMADLNIIAETFKVAILPAPFRAYNDGERKHSRTIAKFQEVVMEQPQTKKRKFSLFGGKNE